MVNRAMGGPVDHNGGSKTYPRIIARGEVGESWNQAYGVEDLTKTHLNGHEDRAGRIHRKW